MKKNPTRAAVIPLLAALVCFAGCSDPDIYTNPSLVIGSYTYDALVDPTQGEGNSLSGSKVEVILTLYSDYTLEGSLRTYRGPNGGIAFGPITSTGTFDPYTGTLENGVIHAYIKLYGAFGQMAGASDNYYMRLVDGTRLVSMAGVHDDWLFGTETASLRADDVKAIADFGNPDYVDTRDYSGQPYTTVTLGEPNWTCYAPDVREANFNIPHGSSTVYGRIHLGMSGSTNSSGGGTKYNDYGVTAGGNSEHNLSFAVPDKSTNSGTIEVTVNIGKDSAGSLGDSSSNITYVMTWARRRYDVRISKIEIKKPSD